MAYSNIGTMLSQLKGQSAYAEQTVNSASGKQLKAAETLLKNLEPGQIFSGEITDIRGSYITITLQNMQSVQARLAENFEFLIGQKAMFQVKDNQDSQLTIRPLSMDAAQNGELMVAERALEAANIQMTEKTLDLVKNLLAANQPIDKQSILSYVRQLAKFPDADIQDLISLHKYQIPVTEENLTQLANYKQFEHSLLKDIDTLEQKLPQMVEQMASESPEKAEAFVRELTAVLYPETAEEKIESPDAVATEQETKAAENPQKPAEKGDTALAGTQDLPEETKKGAVPVKEKPDSLPKLLEELAKPEGKEWKEHAGKLVKEALEEKLLLRPEEVADKERVKEYYKETAEKGEKLKELLHSYGKEASPIEKPVQNMTQNVKFMQSLNEMFTYIQLPLKFSNQQAHGDLYVYTKKKAKGRAEEGLSALLHLDMEHLGSVDVMIRMMGQRVTTNFTLETEELLDFIEQHMDLLEERLENKGYSCAFQVIVKDSEEQQRSLEECLTGLVGEEATQGDIKRFSFDVRA